MFYGKHATPVYLHLLRSDITQHPEYSSRPQPLLAERRFAYSESCTGGNTSYCCVQSEFTDKL